MSVGIVAFIPNERSRTQEELTWNFGCMEMDYEKGKKECIPIWKIFEWEGMRMRLVKVMEYLGANEVRYSNDAVFAVIPDEDCSDFGFSLPLPLAKELLEPLDVIYRRTL
jgi:hypothetical protein